MQPQSLHGSWPLLACMDAQVELRSLRVLDGQVSPILRARWSSFFPKPRSWREYGFPFIPTTLSSIETRLSLVSGSGNRHIRLSGQCRPRKIADFRLALFGFESVSAQGRRWLSAEGKRPQAPGKSKTLSTNTRDLFPPRNGSTAAFFFHCSKRRLRGFSHERAKIGNPLPPSSAFASL